MTEWKWQLRYGMQLKKLTALVAATVLLMGQEGVSSFLSSISFKCPAVFPLFSSHVQAVRQAVFMLLALRVHASL